jgi:type 1 glutamine amidotransferase
MRVIVRALLGAALASLALLIPIASASAGGQGSGGEPRFRALIFSKTAAFRHTECIPQGTVAIAQMALQHHFEVDATENAAQFTDQDLAQYDVVIFLCTTGDVLNAAQQAAFERFIRAGGGYAGIHSASDTEYDWPWYGRLVGAYFRDHPGVAGVNQQFQTATIRVEDRDTAATRDLPRRWVREEEWYNFRSNPRNLVHVLMNVDESTYDPRGYSQPGGSPPMGDHPIAWCHRYDGGRAFYTALGHKSVYFKEPLFLSHILGGLEIAAGLERCRGENPRLDQLARQVVRDCNRDGDLDRNYPLGALRRALREVDANSRCARKIERAIQRAERDRDRSLRQIYRDCQRDGDLDRDYRRGQLRRALRLLPEDLREYTECESAIEEALDDLD